jgi:hypothetical protein
MKSKSNIKLNAAIPAIKAEIPMLIGLLPW